MALTNDEILSWFCATNPLPEISQDRVAALPQPGHSRYRKPTRDDGSRASAHDPPSPTPPSALRTAPEGVGTGGGAAYYGRLSSWQQSMENYPESRFYNYVGIDEEVEEEEYFAGREVNPTANPGDDDYQVATESTIYDDYSFSENYNPDLPIAAYKERVVQTIEANSVTVIQGSTGCGKSTQVPQYLLGHYARERRHCNIICTQPRRIAATSIAKFVCESRGWRLGGLVGYQIGMNRNLTEDTRLTFATTGVLLQKLINMKNMNQYTHVILDEVHERDQDTDFCLLVVRKLLRTNSKHVKVILMSATIESSNYAQYFATKIAGRLEPAPIVNVEGRSFSVTEFYLDDLKHIGVCEPANAENPRLKEDAMDLACKLIEEFDRIEHSNAGSDKDFVRGSVLIFLPGLPEIREMTEKKIPRYAHLRLNVQPLHSSISSEEQWRVFLKPEHGRRKVILATNIAESSITVPDIKYVIDFCLVKEMTCDMQTNYECLKLHWASKAALEQRKGRAGRVSAGRCYRLITREFFRRFLTPYSTPEIQRCSLEKLVLNAKQLDLGEPKAILGLALEPPNLTGIENAIISLKEIGALTVLHRGRVVPYDGTLTFLGQVLASLPVDVRLGKLLVLGHAFGCLEECLVIAAALSQKTFFTKPFGNELRGYRAKISWSDGSFSDCIAVLIAYKEWFRLKDVGNFLVGGNAEKSWCHRNLIEKKVINTVSEVVKELSARLAKFNIKSFRSLISRNSEGGLHDMLILKLVLCGAFYPNYFHWGVSDEELNQKLMSGHDPTTTVMLSGLPAGSEKYCGAISEMFKDCGQGKFLHFEGSKVFVEFARPRPSRSLPVSTPVQPVLDAVYIALKKGHIRNTMTLQVLNETPRSHKSEPLVDWQHRLLRHSQDRSEQRPASVASSLPPGELRTLKLPRFGQQQILVTEVVDAGHFWAQFNDIQTSTNLQSLMDSIEELIDQRRPIPLVSHYSPSDLKDMYCLAMFHVDSRYYRARINMVENCVAQVVFVDYGNVEWVPLDCICELPNSKTFWDLPMQAFECYLTGVKPSYRYSSDGRWSTKAISRFKELCNDKPLIAKIYCEVDEVLRVELYDTVTYKKDDIFINMTLIKEGYAMECTEAYPFRLAHSQSLLEEQTREQEDQYRAAAPEGPGVRLSSGNCITVDWEQPSMAPVAQRGAGKGTTKYTLRGPSNPYEVKFYAMTAVGSMRPARIQYDSVNTIVVDNEPQDKHQRLMVAAHVALNPSGSTCVVRETSLLPNIHGLPYIICLLFAPMAELRCDDLKRQYVGAICGLGFDAATGESLYPEHDIELTFDTLITHDDLNDINMVRLAMNLAVGSDQEGVADWGEHAIKKIQRRAREYIRDLVLKRRDSVVPHQSANQGWNQVAPEDILLTNQEEGDDGRPPLFPMHNGIAISEERIDQQRSTRVLILREKMKELRRKATGSQRPETLTCDLCNVRCSNPRELLLHLGSRLHRIEEQKLFQDDLELDLTEKQLNDLRV